jgi:hypothetical protein
VYQNSGGSPNAAREQYASLKCRSAWATVFQFEVT